MKIGFAIIPNSPMFEQIIEISNLLGEGKFFNSLGKNENLPHITLFQGEFGDEFDYKMVLNLIHSEFKDWLFSGEILFKNLEYVPNGWYFYMCDSCANLTKMHEFCLNLIKDSIILNSERLNRDLSDLSKSEIDSLKKFGYRYAANSYKPHITIGRSNEKSEKMVDALNMELNKFPKTSKIGKLTVYEMGENGTHKSTLSEIKIWVK